jgi:ABC-2 type transport system ATP-binding protein
VIPLTPIETHALTKRFGELTAIEDISITIKASFSASSALTARAKQPTLQMLSGQMPPTSGTAKVLGIDVVADPIAVKAAIGIVPELE